VCDLLLPPSHVEDAGIVVVAVVVVAHVDVDGKR
jgi:hypothetical protein